MERRCEPELMDDPAEARAYAEADFAASDAAMVARFVELFGERLAAHPAPRILDLGCGPGNISLRLVAALADARVLGLDGAAAMLAIAADRRERLSPGERQRLAFLRATLPGEATPQALAALPERFRPPFEAVVSNSLLHHLHRPAVLWRTLGRFAAPGAAVFVRDLRRPPSPAAVATLVARHAAGAPAILRGEFARSLAAAFRAEEVRAQLEAEGLATLQVREVDDRYLEIHGQLP